MIGATTSATCVACIAGSYAPSTCTTACSNCAAGTFGPTAAVTTCSNCAVGQYASRRLLPVCFNCAVHAAGQSGCSRREHGMHGMRRSHLLSRRCVHLHGLHLGDLWRGRWRKCLHGVLRGLLRGGLKCNYMHSLWRRNVLGGRSPVLYGSIARLARI